MGVLINFLLFAFSSYGDFLNSFEVNQLLYYCTQNCFHQEIIRINIIKGIANESFSIQNVYVEITLTYILFWIIC